MATGVRRRSRQQDAHRPQPEQQPARPGVRIVRQALLGCTGLKRLGFSYNEPGIEPALADLLRAHPTLVSIELVEALDRHLPSRAKDDIGRALLENKAQEARLPALRHLQARRGDQDARVAKGGEPPPTRCCSRACS